MKFKEWIEKVIEFDDNQKFLIDGYHTGEIFEWHEWYEEGLTPKEAVKRNYFLHS